MHPLIRRIDAADTLDLRHRVLWPDLPPGAVVLPDDSTAFHFGAFLNSTLVGVGSLFPDGSEARLRKLAVAHEHQGQGIARHMLHHIFTEMRDCGVTLIWCDARVSATPFYERLGLACDGEVFQKSRVDYVRAKRHLIPSA